MEIDKPLYIRLYIEHAENDYVESSLEPAEVADEIKAFSIDELAKWLIAQGEQKGDRIQVVELLNAIFSWYHRITIKDKVYGPILRNNRVVGDTLTNLALVPEHLEEKDINDQASYYLEMRAFKFARDEL